MKSPSNTQVRQEPYLTLNGIVKVLSTSSARDRETLIRNYKYPDPEGQAQAYYYGITRETIHKYHAASNDCGIVDARIDSAQSLCKGATAASVSKLENNIRATRAYVNHFGSKKFVPLDIPKVIVEYEGVSLSMRPDFLATEGKRTRIVRYAFSQKGATDKEIMFSLQLIAFYARLAGIEVQNNDCQLLIVADGTVKTLSGVSTRFEPTLKSAMREVRRHWADI